MLLDGRSKCNLTRCRSTSNDRGKLAVEDVHVMACGMLISNAVCIAIAVTSPQQDVGTVPVGRSEWTQHGLVGTMGFWLTGVRPPPHTTGLVMTGDARGLLACLLRSRSRRRVPISGMRCAGPHVQGLVAVAGVVAVVAVSIARAWELVVACAWRWLRLR